jgi:ATP-binding cassette subfamily F protein 3
VVGGESAYKLAPGVRGDVDEAEESSDSESEETGVAAGTVFRLARGQLRMLERGMEEYEEIAARSAAKLGKAKMII